MKIDLAEHGTNRLYYTVFIDYSPYLYRLNSDNLRELYLEQGLSARQIASQFGVSKTLVLEHLHQMGIRLKNGKNRMNLANNYRCNIPPYGYRKAGKRLIVNRAELKICRIVVQLMGRQKQSATATAKEIGIRGYKNRQGSLKWDHSTVRNIFNRWKEKI